MTGDLTGQTFGRLTIIGPGGQDLPQVAGGWWQARCACGRELVAPAEGFRAGRITSCGRRTPEQREQLAEQIAAYSPPPRL
jgi:hypothetical protein